jgi:hypothetical protein
LLALGIIAVNVAGFLVDVWVVKAEGSWGGQFSNDCGKVVHYPWTMTVPLSIALAASVLSILMSIVWSAIRWKAGELRGSVIFIAIALICCGAFTSGMILFVTKNYMYFRVICTGI